MRFLRPSSFEEFVEWYLHRERRKGEMGDVPATPQDRRTVIRRPGCDKIGDLFSLFEEADWHVVLLEHREELERLVHLDHDWVRFEGLIVPREGKNYRLLRRVADNALASGYLARTKHPGHRAYDRKVGAGLRLAGDERLTLRTKVASEHADNPAGTYYLHDGSGRALPYLIRVVGGMPYQPVEAFLAEER